MTDTRVNLATATVAQLADELVGRLRKLAVSCDMAERLAWTTPDEITVEWFKVERLHVAARALAAVAALMPVPELIEVPAVSEVRRDAAYANREV